MRKQSKDLNDNKEDLAEKAGQQKVGSGGQTMEEKPTRKRGTKTPTSTSPKRELSVFPTDYSMVKVAYVGGGETPKELSGRYSSAAEAKKAIARYLYKKT